MKPSHRKDVILARLVFVVFILLVASILYSVGSKIVAGYHEKVQEVEEEQKKETEASGWQNVNPMQDTENGGAETAEGDIVYMVTTSSVNLRVEANAESNRLETLPTGTEVILIKLDGEWAEVDHEGLKGFVSAQYLEKSRTATVNEQGQTVSKVVVTDDVNMRKGPSTDTSKITGVSKGTELDSIGEENGWTKVIYEGKEGYIRSDFIKTK